MDSGIGGEVQISDIMSFQNLIFKDTSENSDEEYNEMQFQENYFKDINNHLAPNFVFDEKGRMINIDLPLELSAAEKKILLSYLWKIEINRNFILSFYSDVENKANQVLKRINPEWKK